MASFSVRKPFTVLVVILIVFALGITSFSRMKPELLPNMELPYVITITTYPGATSEKVEEEVTRSLEQSFATLEGLKSISSQSQANYSMVMMEFTDGANLDRVTIDMLQNINQVSGGWDDLIGEPIIMKINPNMLPVMIAAVEREGYDTTELSAFVEEELQIKMEGIDGVASLDVSGLRREQVNVAIRAEKVAVVNSWIEDAIRNEIGEQEYDLRKTRNELQSQLNELKQKDTELQDGMNQFAEGIGEGWAEWAKAINENLSELRAQLSILESKLLDIQAQTDPDVQAAIDAAILEFENENNIPPGSLDPNIAAGIAAVIWSEAEAQMQGTITQIQAGIATMEDSLTMVAQAQGTIGTMTIETQFSLSSAAAQIAAAQVQLTAGIAQIESGLEQFDEALETALSSADMSGVLTMSMISNILKAQNFDMPAGYVQQESTDYLVRVGDEATSLEELQGMALMDTGIEDVGVIRLSDVADVFISDNLADIYAKINGNDGVLFQFSKQSEYSTTEVTDAIMEKFSELSAQYPGLNFTPLMNQGDYIYMVINSITSDLLWGALFAIIILLLFLRDIRPTFITLCAIPISLVFALVAMYFAGVTINIISLSGLAIAVGRLVDDSVVVIENIFRLRNKGYSPVKAAISGTMQVAGAITASTLTTICVFLPLVFVQGLTRQIFKDFGLTFAFALLASLAVAMTLVPTLASNMFKSMEPKEHRLFDRMLTVYDKALVWALKYKPVVLIFAVVMLVVSFGAVWTKGFEYMPAGVSNQVTVTLTMPKETSVTQSKERADEAAALIEEIDGVETVGMISSSGTGGTLGMLMGGGGDDDMHSMSSYVLLEEGSDYERITAEIDNALQNLDMEVSVSNNSGMDASALGGSGITINVFADETMVLMESAKTIGDKVSGVEGIEEVDEGLEDATPELHFTVDREKAAEYGLTTAQVYAQVSAALTKESSATQVTWGDTAYDVVIINEYAEEDDLTPDYIKDFSFMVTKQDGEVERVRLSEIASVEENQSLPAILRSDQRRYIPVTATVGSDYNVSLVTQEVEAALSGVQLSAGVSYTVTGENETIMDAFGQLGLMLLLGLLLVYLIMVAQFQSLKSPFIIMFTIPLAFTGGFLALLIAGQILSVISLIGFAMLVGVIVANAIVLVDYINRLRLDGADRNTAIREGAATRMRPILMTALATIGALLMMALGVGEGSAMMQPLAVVCIGGLAYGTLMTLFVIPVIYDAFNKKELRKIDTEDLVVDLEA